MFHRIVAAFNEKPESKRALLSAIRLAKTIGAQLDTVTVVTELPAYVAFADGGGPGIRHQLESGRAKFYEDLREQAQFIGTEEGIELQAHLVDGHEVDAIVEFLRSHKADLLVVGIHHREMYVARLWSTVYELAQSSPCSVLGVH
jgi:nucleotide-binding universal stress UspA family protein